MRYIKILLTMLIVAAFLVACNNDDDRVIGELDEVQQEHTRVKEMVRSQEFDQAEELINQLIEDNEDNASLYLTKADIYISQQDYETAVGYLEIAIEKNESFTEAYSNIAGAYMLMKDYDAAMDYIDQGLEVKPDHEEFQFKKGQLLYVNQEFQSAVDTLTPLTEDDFYFEAWRFIGLAQLQLENEQAAIEAFEKYLELAPENIQLRDQIEKQVEALKQ